MNLNPFRSIRQAIAQRSIRYDADQWLDAPEGCCTCGTGGPYCEGDAPQVTRYLYVGATRTGNEPDWSSCSSHPLPRLIPVVDYGRDVVVTARQGEADVAFASSATAYPVMIDRGAR